MTIALIQCDFNAFIKKKKKNLAEKKKAFTCSCNIVHTDISNGKHE